MSVSNERKYFPGMPARVGGDPYRFWLYLGIRVGFIFHSYVAAGFAFLIPIFLRMIYTFMWPFSDWIGVVLKRATAAKLSGFEL